jgi:hypothetical protein
MKQLSKVIFINSASIPYGEVIVDGNVHLIGNQGVGKSTVLRAMLFFYNANTKRLDISPNKKRFKEYYFPFSNSHLVYEIQRENGAYCVWVFKSRNKIMYRFIDKPYNQSYFLEEFVAKSNKEIEQNLDALGISYSNQIESFSEYKDILYGKGQTVNRKYALFRSKVYDNIPRTITNIFLNHQLQGNFIKETIINSIINSETAAEVDLNVIGTQVANFQNSHKEIEKFKKHEKEGQWIIDTYLNYENIKTIQQTTAEQLGIALNKAKVQVENLKEELVEQQKDKHQSIQELNTLETGFQENDRELTKKIGAIEDKLKQVDELISKYNKLKINDLITLNDKKQIIKVDLERSQKVLEILTTKFQSIEAQYQTMFDKLESDKEKFESKNQKAVNNLESNIIQQEKEVIKENQVALDLLDEVFKDKISAAESNQEDVRIIEKEVFVALELTKKNDFLKDDLAEVITEKRELEKQQLRVERDLDNEKNQLENYRKDAIQKLERLKKTTDESYKELQTKLSKIADELKITQNNIEIYQDTIYGFLDNNYENWRNTIGKVFRDEVLLNTDLEPAFVANKNAFFGLSINLDKLEKSAKQQDDFVKQRKDFIAQQADLQEAVEKLNTESANEVTNIKKNQNSKIRKLEQEIKNFEQILQENERKIDRLELGLKDLGKEAKRLKQQAIEKQTTLWQNAKSEVKIAQNNLENVRDDKRNEIYEIDEKFDKIISKKQEDCDLGIKKLNDLCQATLDKFNEEKQQLTEAQRKALTEKGAEIERIDIVRKDIEKYKNLLDNIDKNLPKIYQYQSDKLNFIDKKSVFEYDYQQLTKQLDTITQIFQTQKGGMNNAIELRNQEIKSIEEKQSSLNSDLKTFARKFELMEDKIKQWIMKSSTDWKVKKTFQDLAFELDEIKAATNTTKDKLITKINTFRSYLFNENNNKFGLPYFISSFEEYLGFAKRLKKLFDDSSITILEREIGRQFDISLNSIIKKTEELSNIKYKVDDVVRRINKSFVERKFVDAIDKIEIQTVVSQRKVVIKLLDIQQFYNDNALEMHNLGGLFSTESQTNHSKRVIELLSELSTEIEKTNSKNIKLEDGFELQFRIIENNNATEWVKNLSNVGSNGTDVLAKAMIYIMLLNTFKNIAARKDDDFRIHCIIDEVGILHDLNLKGLIDFANHYKILLINGSPNSNDANAYRYVYQLTKNEKRQTAINLIMVDGRKA